MLVPVRDVAFVANKWNFACHRFRNPVTDEFEILSPSGVLKMVVFICTEVWNHPIYAGIVSTSIMFWNFWLGRQNIEVDHLGFDTLGYNAPINRGSGFFELLRSKEYLVLIGIPHSSGIRSFQTLFLSLPAAFPSIASFHLSFLKLVIAIV